MGPQRLSALLIVLAAAVPAAAQLPGLKSLVDDKGPDVKVELLAERTAIAPGQAIDLAVKFTIPDKWHIYWRNRGEGGLEPTFNWHLPEGFEIGAMRFPPPVRHVDEIDTHTFILEGEPVLLATLKAPRGLEAGGKIAIGLDASWLVCRKACFMGDKPLSLELPVVEKAADAKPTDEAFFKAARNALPGPMDKAKHLKRLAAVANVDKIKPGSTFRIAVVLEVEDGQHINAHKPLGEFLIPTDVFHDSVEGLSFERPEFPKGTVEKVKGLDEKIAVYRGRGVIPLTVEADEGFSGKTVTVSGVATYQSCSDKTGTCYPPAAAEWSLSIPVAGKDDEVKAANAEFFQAAATDGSGGDGAGGSAGKGFTLDGANQVTAQKENHSFAVWLGLAFLAGLILNVTPCVLPVISIKVLSFVRQASESPAKVFKLGLAFSFGMLLVFNVLAMLATGLGLAWGQHFQSPQFTIVMAAIVFAFGLSLFGVFEIGVPARVGNVAAKAEGEGYAGSIAKGALATVMGTPCLGPFLGSVLVWAAGQPAPTVFLVFNTIGLGMAFPYVLLTAHPKWLKFVPKPGNWMIAFKQGMGFLLMGTVVYLLYIFQGQLGGRSAVWATAFLTGVGLACWVFGTFWSVNAGLGRRLAVAAVSLAVILGAGLLAFGSGIESQPQAERAAVNAHGPVDWEPFSLARLEELTAAGKTVFLDITADWCPNCQVNSKLVFDTPEMADVLARHDVVPMLADWTSDRTPQSAQIKRLINALTPGASIPWAGVFPPGKDPIVMTGLVTKNQVFENIRRAAGDVEVASSSR